MTSEQGNPSDPPAFRWVRDEDALVELAAALDGAAAHAFDSESNSGFVYRERLCLLQFNVEGRLWLVDLLALPGEDRALEPLRPSLESSEITTWLHGGEFDVGSMKRDYDIELGGVWDTQQAASFLGWERTGYGAVVERVCDVELEKAYAHYDWGRRPVADEALHYALDDVVYLPRVAASLTAEVAESDLEDEVAQANRAVMEAVWSGPSARQGIWRVKGVHKLSEAQLKRFTALWEWREAEAKRRDLPPGRLLHPEVLMALARRNPRSVGEVKGAGVRGRNARYAEELADVLRRAEQRPPRVPERPRGERPSPGEGKRLKKLKQWRRGEAERRGVPYPVVLPPVAMQHLARHGATDLGTVPQLGERRIQLYGETLTGLCN